MAIGTFKLPIGSTTATASTITYTRPADWLTMPTPGVQEVIGLMAVYDDGGNYVALQCQGNYTVDWGDGTITNYASNAVASYQHTFSSLSSSTLTSKGFRQALVRITPQSGQNLTLVSFGVQHPTLAKSYAPGWLEFDIRTPNALPTFSGGINNIRYARLEKITVRQMGTQNPQNWCTNLFNLRSVYIEPTETSHCTAFNNMFQSCYALIEVNNFNTNAGTNFNLAFSSCYSLENVPNFNLSSSTNVSSMFDGCSSLKIAPNLTLGTSAASLFTNCNSLTTVTEMGTSNVTDFTSMFFQCGALETVSLFDTSKGTNFTTMFSTCRSLKSIPLFNTILGQNFTSMFSSCNSLTEIPLLNTVAATNMTGMFNGCNNIMYLPALNTANVTTLNQTFQNCYNLREFPAFSLPVCTVFSSWLTNVTTLSKSGIINATRGHSYSGMSLSQANIVTAFTNLGTASGTQTIVVTANPGTATLTAGEKLIATSKGWTIAV